MFELMRDHVRGEDLTMIINMYRSAIVELDGIASNYEKLYRDLLEQHEDLSTELESANEELADAKKELGYLCSLVQRFRTNSCNMVEELSPLILDEQFKSLESLKDQFSICNEFHDWLEKSEIDLRACVQREDESK